MDVIFLSSKLQVLESVHHENYTNNDVKALVLEESSSLYSFPSGIPDIFPNVDEIYLSNNEIESIERSDFFGLDSLFSVSFYKNQLEKLPEDVFWDLKNLQDISFSNNKLTNFPTKIFHNLLKLRRFYAKSNYLHVLKPEVFLKNTMLETIDLSSNRLAKVAPFNPSLEINYIGLANNFCIDIKIYENKEIEILNKVLARDCINACKDEEIKMCAEKLYSCKAEKRTLVRTNTALKNLKRRALVL